MNTVSCAEELFFGGGGDGCDTSESGGEFRAWWDLFLPSPRSNRVQTITGSLLWSLFPPDDSAVLSAVFRYVTVVCSSAHSSNRNKRDRLQAEEHRQDEAWRSLGLFTALWKTHVWFVMALGWYSKKAWLQQSPVSVLFFFCYKTSHIYHIQHWTPASPKCFKPQN